MKIAQIKKGKRNLYIITFENQQNMECYDDIMVKYALLPKKELSETELEQIRNENHELESYYLALNYMTKRLRSKKEIKEYLKQKNYSTKEIENTVNHLQEKGYLNEDIYIESYLNDNFRFSANGPDKIQKSLEDLDFNKNKINEKLEQITKEEWCTKLRHLFQKKATSTHNDGTEKWKRKCEIYFYNLGYPKEWILEIENTIEWKDDITKLEKEYHKQKQKWSRKYQGNELNFQIKRKLYEKGYPKEIIDNFLNHNQE